MELNQEINQLLLCCEDKEFIKTNISHLKSYFSIPHHLHLLRLVLTTNRNFTALKIIEKLDLDISPYIHINTFTYISIYWLYKMNKIPLDQFDSLKRKFQVLNNFDDLHEKTEMEFLSLQINKKRRKIKKTPSKFLDLNSFFKKCEKMIFIFNLDSLVDIEKFIRQFQDLRNSVFDTDVKSFEEFPNDPDRFIKQSRFKEIKNRLVNSSQRNFTNFFSLDFETKGKLENLMNILNKIRRCGFKYYLTSSRPLPSILTFCYLHINLVDLTKVIEVQPQEEMNLPIPGRKVYFGGEGNIKYEFLKQMANNLNRYVPEYTNYFG